MLWGITSFFNPVGYQTKKANYDRFRAHLKIPLITVELSYNNTFELKTEDADHLICIHGKDVMWQKERLLNIALGSLPEDCTAVAWLDADLIFENQNWPQETLKALEKHAFVQPFNQLRYLKSEETSGEIKNETKNFTSFASAYQTKPFKLKTNGKQVMGQYTQLATGKAWAGRRSILEQSGFYDAMIMGGGDGAMLNAMIGTFNDFIAHYQLNTERAEHYTKWALQLYSLTQSNLGVVPGQLTHLWHGNIQNRSYQERKKALATLNFNPYTDIKHIKNGPWQWASKHTELHQLVSQYFYARKEDG